MPLDAQSYRRALEQLGTELPDLMPGHEATQLVGHLKRYLDQDDANSLARAARMAAQHPAVRRRVRELLDVDLPERSLGMYGNPITGPKSLCYHCEVGGHYLTPAQVRRRDAYGRPLCPDHNTPMTPQDGPCP